MYYDKKKMAIIIMLVVVLFMTVVYAVFSSSLNISGTANIGSNWNVYISSITTKNVSGKAENATGSPSFSNLNAVISANLKIPGDSIEYEVTITNGGTLDAVIDEIDVTSAGTDAIIYYITGIQKGNKIIAGTSAVFNVKIEYDVSVTGQPEEETKVVTINVNCVQDLDQNIDNEDIIINNATLTTLSGSNSLLLPNSVDSFLNNYIITGNSVQNGTPSLNTPAKIENVATITDSLYDFSLDNIVLLPYSEGETRYGFEIGVLEAKDYTISFELQDPSNVPTYIYFRTKDIDGSYSSVHLITDEVRRNTYTFTADGSSSYYVVFANGLISTLEKAKTSWSKFKNFQIVEGSSASEFEPHGKYKLLLNVKGENLFDNNFIPYKNSSNFTVTATDTGIKFQSTGDYDSDRGINTVYIIGKVSDYVGKKLTFAFDFKSSGQRGRVIFATGNDIFDTKQHIGGGSYYKTGTLVVQSTNVITQEMADNIEYPYIVAKVYYQDREATKAGDFAIYDNFRIYEGEYTADTMPEYIPYYNHTNAIYLDEPLRCIDGVCDYLDFSTRRIVRNVRSFSLNIEDMNNEVDYPGWKYSKSLKYLKYLSKDYPNTNSDLLLKTSVWSNISSLNDNAFGINTVLDNSKLWLKKEYFNLSQTEWLANYSELNVNVLYKLAVPQFERIDLPNIYIPSGNNTLSIINKNGVEVPISLNYYKK